MRRALLLSLPALSQYFGLMPWDAERLTFRELQAYLRRAAALDEQQRAITAAVRGRR